MASISALVVSQLANCSRCETTCFERYKCLPCQHSLCVLCVRDLVQTDDIKGGTIRFDHNYHPSCKVCQQTIMEVTFDEDLENRHFICPYDPECKFIGTPSQLLEEHALGHKMMKSGQKSPEKESGYNTGAGPSGLTAPT